jgi:parallel beta-helix repeat protein
MMARLVILLLPALAASAVLAAGPLQGIRPIPGVVGGDAPTRILRVAPEGGDYSTIQAAVDAASPGDTIVVADGTYNEAVTIAKPSLTLRSENLHGARIVGGPSRDGVRLKEGANYITIDGFDITAGYNGVHAHEERMDHVLNHHTIVRNCHIHDCGAGGVQLNLGDYRLVENNVVERCAAVAPWCSSGISICVPIAEDREPGFHIVIRGNILYRNSNPPRGTDGNGIIIDSFRHAYSGGADGDYPNSTLVENNVAYDNGARGIHVFKSAHVVVRNNTVYHNNWDLTNDATWRGELSCVDSSDVKWYNNIAVADSATNPHNTAILDADTDRYRNRDVEWVGNLLFDSANPSSHSIKIASDADEALMLAGNMVGSDPQFAAPGEGPDADFRLKAGSPAIGAGRAANAAAGDLLGMQRDGQPDVGAYECGATAQAPQQH